MRHSNVEIGGERAADLCPDREDWTDHSLYTYTVSCQQGMASELVNSGSGVVVGP